MFTLLAYLLILLITAVLIYAGWRMTRAARDARPKTRMIGPDDDPEFLWRLGRDDDDTTQR